MRGKRGCGAKGKVPVFGILKRNGEVHLTSVKNCSKTQLLPILKGKVLEGNRVYSDGWKPYEGLVYNYDHYRVYHSKNEFAQGKNHINDIEYPRVPSLDFVDSPCLSGVGWKVPQKWHTLSKVF